MIKGFLNGYYIVSLNTTFNSSFRYDCRKIKLSDTSIHKNNYIYSFFFLSVKHIKKLFVISVDFTESVPHLFLLCCGVLNNTSVKAVSATLQLYVENKGLQG